MMGGGMGGMATIDRVEGRIAFLRAELKITDAQADAWNGFADALRTNAKKLAEVRVSMMPKPGERNNRLPPWRPGWTRRSNGWPRGSTACGR